MPWKREKAPEGVGLVLDGLISWTGHRAYWGILGGSSAHGQAKAHSVLRSSSGEVRRTEYGVQHPHVPDKADPGT